eukprot:CAMPEP_0170617838 /NCGR_PEP_ID=MMETSP0224-20130122/26636_1 /TAXON_ID=285029 /ORGANISM="Togula jolla, Strain CCCM 725" /LENGTH=126 /DNA_ID=CAMNT_0010943767 /DNA_START=342 /DNA_END=722 /DNA_ORIENTATION=-
MGCRHVTLEGQGSSSGMASRVPPSSLDGRNRGRCNRGESAEGLVRRMWTISKLQLEMFVVDSLEAARCLKTSETARRISTTSGSRIGNAAQIERKRLSPQNNAKIAPRHSVPSALNCHPEYNLKVA